MRRDSRKKPVDEGLDVKKMVYITGSVLALAVIVFVITFLLYSNKLENETNLGKLNTNTIGNISAEQASTQYGKTVNEVKDENKETGSTEGSSSSDGNKSGADIQNGDTSNSSSTSNSESKIAINTSATEQKVENSKQTKLLSQKKCLIQNL